MCAAMRVSLFVSWLRTQLVNFDCEAEPRCLLNKNNRFAAWRASQLVGGETERADRGRNMKRKHWEMRRGGTVNKCLSALRRGRWAGTDSSQSPTAKWLTRNTRGDRRRSIAKLKRMCEISHVTLSATRQKDFHCLCRYALTYCFWSKKRFNHF